MARGGLIRLGLMLGAIVLALLLGEAAFRVLDISYYWSLSKRPDPVLGWRPAPHAVGWQRFEGEARVETNALGFRDIDHPLVKPADTLRIAVLGDSFTAAVQVPLEATWWRVMGKQLERCAPTADMPVEVLSFAVSGYSTAQALLAWRALASRYRPDLVVLGFFHGNDLVENTPALDEEPMRPYLREHEAALELDEGFLGSAEYRFRTAWYGRAAFWLLTHSRILQAIDQARDAWRVPRVGKRQPQERRPGPPAEPGVDSQIYSTPRDAQWRGAWRATEAILAHLHREVEATGARLWVATLSTGAQVYPDPRFRDHYARALGVSDLYYPERRIAAAGETAGYAVVNLAPELAWVASVNGLFLHGFEDGPQGVGHWNAAAHALAGEILARELCTADPWK